MAVFIIVLAMGAGSAWSLDRFDPAGAVEGAHTAYNFSTSSSPDMADGCLPLLKSIRHTSATSVMDRNQRTAGKAAALGLVFGMRFALEPSRKAKSPKPRLDVWQPQNAFAGDQRALAIADYRKCQKEKALNSSIQAIHDFRWTR
ncbi:MAG: hypothetical protein ACLFR0_01960 [Alphaproteobacteria bacterium]